MRLKLPRAASAALALATALLSGCESQSWSGPGAPAPAPAANRPEPAARRARPVRPPAAPAVARQPMPATVRAVWVARFHYATPDDVREIIANSAEMGFNTVLWQVRGNGTVRYPSELEVWDEAFAFQDPGFDPLEVAVEEAHARGLRIEAWINVMPGWRGKRPPEDRRQLWWSQPDWFLADADGARQPLGDFYVILNPCLPEVRDHVAALAEELVTRYPIDGVHLDYVRYAWETTPGARDAYPRDARTVALYERATGLRPEQDPAAWDNWRINQLSELVAQVRAVVSRAAPGATLTAATWSDPVRGLNDYFQNVLGWLRAGLLDAAYPMTYTDDAARLEQYVGIYRREAPGARIIPGLGVYKHERAEQFAQQLELCQRWGGDFCVFSYESLRAVAGDRNAQTAALRDKNELRRMRRDVLGQLGAAGQ